MKISFIVPVYNTEIFLEKCLDSIVNQNLNEIDYEVIIINDGSPDNSQELINRFTDRYSNFYSIITPNMGLSSARNEGVDRARGDYIFFVDSDDYLEENSVHKVLKQCYEDELDCISFDYKKVYEDNHAENTLIRSYKCKEKVYNSVDFLCQNTVVSNVWKYLFKRKIITENYLYFIPNIYHEDEDFTTIYLSYSNRIKHVNVLVYNYLQRKNSIMNTSDIGKKKKKIEDMISVIRHLRQRSDNTSGLLKRGIERKTEQLLVSVFLRLKKDDMGSENIKLMRLNLRKDGLYPIRIKYQNWKFKLMTFVINHPLLYSIYYSIK
ncbi:glycosyltransferase [Riemerella anatipestifer]|nr:glycosyltransferase [Riemerella anatipestifer]